MRYLRELIDEKRNAASIGGEVVLPDRNRLKRGNTVNIIALGDVGGMVLTGLRLLARREHRTRGDIRSQRSCDAQI